MVAPVRLRRAQGRDRTGRDRRRRRRVRRCDQGARLRHRRLRPEREHHPRVRRDRAPLADEHRALLRGRSAGASPRPLGGGDVAA